MPGYRAHIMVGVSTCLGLLYAINTLTHPHTAFLQTVGCIAAAILGSIFPDIDTTSKMQRIFFIFSSMALLISIFFQAWFFFFNLSFITVVVTFLKHRTLTHSAWFIFALSIISILLSSIIFHETSTGAVLTALCFAVGALSHLVLDFWL
jgi:hypothetical protein